MATFVKFSKQLKRYYVTDDLSQAFYPCTDQRLASVIKSYGLPLKIKSKRSPRLAIIQRYKKQIQTDRLWSLTECLQEAAEIIHTLQTMDRKCKLRYYKKMGL